MHTSGIRTIISLEQENKPQQITKHKSWKKWYKYYKIQKK